MNLKETANDYLKLGLNPVPVAKGSKVPIREGHINPITESEIDDYNWQEIGISTGYASGNLEALDFDLKNSEDPDKFLQDYKDLVGEELLQKLVVQITPSGGYHFIYRCDVVESSQKLAKNEEGHAILETRGIGGYIKCYPSEGYEVVKKSFEEIPYISSEERFRLFVSGRKLNKLIKEDSNKRIPQEQRDYQSKFPEYDSDPEIGISMLEEAGWTEHSRIGDWINFTRPGKEVSDGMSGGYNLNGNFFYAFSTSQDNFITERPYSNHQIYAELECNGNYSKAYAKLFEDGHGDESIEDDEEALSFLSDVKEENTYLDQARKGEVEYGLTTGWPVLDENFRIKKNSLNLGLGVDNVGKSVFMMSLITSTNIIHDMTWGVVCPENKNPVTRQRSIESLSGKPITYFSNRENEYKRYLQYSRDKLHIVGNREHYSIPEVISMGKKLYEYEGIDALLIDPFNFFLTEGNGYASDNNVLSKLRVFAETYCSVYVMAHPYSGFTREKVNKEGYLDPPTKYDAQGGSNFAYRVDDVFTIHRIINHPSNEIRKEMQFIVGKVKELHTGGRVHDKDDYTSMVWDTRDSFTGYWDEQGNNPMYKAMLSKLGKDSLSQKGLGDRIKY